MTNDVTAPLTELRAAYRAYQNAKRDKKEEIREKYEARIADEVRAAVEAEKYAFAKLLADRKEFYDLRVTDIQDHVLRTRNWKVWEDIRDYADIAPEQVVREQNRTAKKEADALAAKTHDFNELGHLIWYKDKDGNNYLHPLVFSDYSTRRNEVYIPDILDDVVKEYGWTEFAKEASKAIAAAFEAGTIPARESIYDQKLDYEDATKAKAYRDSLNNDWKK
jgi:hypothetical protein